MIGTLWARRLHSLSGVVPVGGYLVLHLFELAQARRGAAVFDAISRDLNSQWWLPAAEFVLLAGLLYHAAYGLAVTLRARYRGVSHPWGHRGLAFVLQRWSGAFLLAFIIYHLWHFRLQKVFGTLSAAPTYAEVSAGLQGPGMQAFYLLGTLAAAWHLGNGLSTLLIAWGVTVSPRSQRWAAAVGQALGAAVGALGLVALFSLRG